jgi:5-methylcytosine-specific restriction enzyme subunit McrC
MIPLVEGGDWTEVELTEAQARALDAAEFVDVRPVSARRWRLRARHLVGAARIDSIDGPVEIRIEPKTSIERLLFLIGYAQRSLRWRDEEVDAGERTELLPAVAHAFARAAERALRQGVLHGYRQVEEALPQVRGRIRETDQLRRTYGLPVPVQVTYDDHTVDVVENRLLLAAARRLLALPRIPPETRKLLRHLLLRLDGVGHVPYWRSAHEPPEWTPNRLNTRYQTALGLASLVLRGGSYELADGRKVRVDGLLLEVWRIFQEFVATALTDELLPHGGRVAAPDKSLYLDRDRQIKLEPDFVYRDPSNRPRIVADIKYKAPSGKPSNDDLLQILAYSAATGLPRGHLIFAAGTPTPDRYFAEHVGIEIHCHTLDLDRPPTAVLAQIRSLAARLLG